MFQVKLTQTASQTLSNLHPEIKKQLKSILKTLYTDPYAGKLLRNELSSFRSLKMKRYRAIYHVDNPNKTVIILAIGHRRNIYEIVTSLTIKL